MAKQSFWRRFARVQNGFGSGAARNVREILVAIGGIGIAGLLVSGCAGRAPQMAPTTATPQVTRASDDLGDATSCGTRSTDPLLLMTFNIRVGFGDERRGVRPQYLALRSKDLGPIVTSIRSVDPDVVALQEVLTSRQGQRIADALGMHYTFASHLGNGPLWGVAILSKCPITGSEAVQVSNEAGNKRRALVASVAFDDGTVDFASLHTDPDVDIDTQLAALSQAAWQRDVILMGDFNVPPTDDGLDRFRQGFTDTAQAAPTTSALAVRERGTISGREAAKRRIDYIFVPKDRFAVLDAGLSLDAYAHASDHRAYYTLVQVAGGDPG
ncbi:endonuclease/exonuclease/phosphatase family protein [uncultured Maritimibacter sp.]|jgi:endonuclease/exonuclease/phosphatase family metal-dependent hydrolase|uniref:endonuclease/exonuclease/phosphatase family protein n=1 Tax=uncultured Maritimibacter sp. TaxID=991866 RepID=UPI00261C46EE|nr:endonuclease/exonuclease/phosphatase family protein [uncultured Maritimibacter sp.]